MDFPNGEKYLIKRTLSKHIMQDLFLVNISISKLEHVISMGKVIGQLLYYLWSDEKTID
ncbi:hypothetical protein L950_0222805 [Sphingobacterium sp. IITKGP-BTPF85]|nr:hypothetical protein L950_0222805 [Sphingobacterium sp. IITKGP-BTPF85]